MLDISYKLKSHLLSMNKK